MNTEPTKIVEMIQAYYNRVNTLLDKIEERAANALSYYDQTAYQEAMCIAAEVDTIMLEGKQTHPMFLKHSMDEEI